MLLSFLFSGLKRKKKCSGLGSFGNLPIVTLKSFWYQSSLSTGLHHPHVLLLSWLWNIDLCLQREFSCFLQLCYLAPRKLVLCVVGIVVEILRLLMGTEGFSKQLFHWAFIWRGPSPSCSRCMFSLRCAGHWSWCRDNVRKGEAPLSGVTLCIQKMEG